MNLVVAGTPEFAVNALQGLLDAGHQISLVLTQPDRPAGRGMQLHAAAVKTWALARGLPLAQPRHLKSLDAALHAALAAADVLVVVAYGLLLPQAVLDLPRLGCINIHASLLPRWRGAAPVQRALLAGDSHSGVTIMQMEAGLDTGPMLHQRRIAIGATDTTGSLLQRLAQEGALACCEVLTSRAHLQRLQMQAVPQPSAGVLYAAKISKDEAWVNWQHSASAIARQLRAFLPAPGLTFAAEQTLQAARIKLWQAALEPRLASSFVLPPSPAVCQAPQPGTVLAWDAQGLAVACSANSVLRLQIVQRAGGKRLTCAQWLQSLPKGALQPGMVLR